MAETSQNLAHKNKTSRYGRSYPALNQNSCTATLTRDRPTPVKSWPPTDGEQVSRGTNRGKQLLWVLAQVTGVFEYCSALVVAAVDGADLMKGCVMLFS